MVPVDTSVTLMLVLAVHSYHVIAYLVYGRLYDINLGYVGEMFVVIYQ